MFNCPNCKKYFYLLHEVTNEILNTLLNNFSYIDANEKDLFYNIIFSNSERHEELIELSKNMIHYSFDKRTFVTLMIINLLIISYDKFILNYISSVKKETYCCQEICDYFTISSNVDSLNKLNDLIIKNFQKFYKNITYEEKVCDNSCSKYDEIIKNLIESINLPSIQIAIKKINENKSKNFDNEITNKTYGRKIK